MKPTAGKNLGAKSGIRSLKILVVEDDAQMRTGLGVFFKLLGCQARFAPDVAAAGVALFSESFDVLLSDINLPDGTGWALMPELQRVGRRPAVAIAMSGLGTDADVSASREAGFDLHLIKPFAPQELLSALQQAAESLPETESPLLPPLPPLPPKRKVAHAHAEVRPTTYSYPCV